MKAAKGDAEAVKPVADYFTTSPLTMATMLSNHDLFAGKRLWDQVEGNVAQYKLAAATYLLQPGTPFIYYGEEIGMAGVSELQDDEQIRTPMSWTAEPGKAGFTSGTPYRPISPNASTQNAAAERARPDSIFAFYKSLLALRNGYPSLAQGNYHGAWTQGAVMAFQRTSGKETALVVINYGNASTQVTVPGVTAKQAFQAVYPSGSVALKVSASSTAEITLAPQTVQVFVTRR